MEQVYLWRKEEIKSSVLIVAVYSSVRDYLKTSDSSGEKVERPQKEGYDEENNEIVNVGNYFFSVPSYWKADIITPDHYRAYAETSDKVAMLEIIANYDEDPVTYGLLVEDNDTGKMSDADYLVGINDMKHDNITFFHSTKPPDPPQP